MSGFIRHRRLPRRPGKPFGQLGFGLLLAFVLLAAQQAALLHGIAHGVVESPERARLPGAGVAAALSASPALAAAPASSTVRALAPAPQRAAASLAGTGGVPESASYCDKCFLFATVAGLAFAALPALVGPQQPARGITAAAWQARGFAPLRSRSRDPPLPL